MKGRVVLITGGARGMGAVTARALAALGAHVIVADWEGEHGTRACAEINAQGPGSAEFVYCNVSSLASVRALARTVLERHAALHVLINNAGITYPRRRLSEDGHEMHFATCHLGHFLLTRLLAERLAASAPARVLFIASEGHKACKGLDFNDLQNEQLWRGKAVNHGAGFMAYARAKLCMIHAMRGFAAQLAGRGVTVNAVSPGYFVNTGIHREMEGFFKWSARVVFGLGALLGLSTPEKGARTHIWAASAPELAGVTGKYFQDRREIAPSPAADNAQERQQLWELSETMAGAR